MVVVAECVGVDTFTSKAGRNCSIAQLVFPNPKAGRGNLVGTVFCDSALSIGDPVSVYIDRNGRPLEILE